MIGQRKTRTVEETVTAMEMVIMVTMKNGEGVVIDGQFKSYGSELR